MKRAGDCLHGELYVGPTMTYVPDPKRVYNISPNQHWAVGTRDDIDRYMKEFPNGYQKTNGF